jgi:hypothetical protein
VPFLVRWPGKIPAGSLSNGIQTHEDVFATLAAAAGIPRIREKLKKEARVCIDGGNNLDYWLGKSKLSSSPSLTSDYCLAFSPDLRALSFTSILKRSFWESPSFPNASR